MSEVLAGKIGVTNGGEWNAETNYEEATFVRYQNNLYLSNLPSVGVEPTNEEYWMLAMEGFSGEDLQTLIDSINNIIDGTTQVGNAKTLDGHGADYFAPLEALANHTIPVYTVNNAEELSSVLAELHANAEDSSVYKAKLIVRFVDNILGAGGVWSLQGFRDDSLYGWQRFGYYSRDRLLKARPLINGAWGSVQTFVTLSDLANYLPLTGGKISAPKHEPLTIENTAEGTNATYIRFMLEGVVKGQLGVSSVGTPIFYSNDKSTSYELLHTGNKPTGSYTGNGSATERTINTGGVGNTLIVRNQNNVILVTPNGTFGKKGTSFVALENSSAKFAEGVLTLSTDDSTLNYNGYAYYYQVL